MITGITILNTYDTSAVPLFVVISLMVLAIALIALGIDSFNEGMSILGIGSCVMGIIILVFGLMHMVNPDISHNVEALIDPQTPFIDVYENYEIKDKHGEIYHLILKQGSEAMKNE